MNFNKSEHDTTQNHKAFKCNTLQTNKMNWFNGFSCDVYPVKSGHRHLYQDDDSACRYDSNARTQLLSLDTNANTPDINHNFWTKKAYRFPTLYSRSDKLFHTFRMNNMTHLH